MMALLEVDKKRKHQDLWGHIRTFGDTSGALGHSLGPGNIRWTSWRGGRASQIQFVLQLLRRPWVGLHTISEAPKEVCTEEINVDVTGQ